MLVWEGSTPDKRWNAFDEPGIFDITTAFIFPAKIMFTIYRWSQDHQSLIEIGTRQSVGAGWNGIYDASFTLPGYGSYNMDCNLI
jgi:hypothetical protein